MTDYSKEDFLTVLKDMYPHSHHPCETHFPRHERVLWLLPLIYEQGERFQRLTAIETLFAQGLKTLRAIAVGIDANVFEKSPEFLATVLALNSDIRNDTRYDHDTFGLEAFTLPGLVTHLTISSAGRRQLRNRYCDDDLDNLFDILVGNRRVGPQTLLNMIDAFEEFVNKV